MLGITAPVLSAFLAYLILSEALTIRHLIGILFMGVGLYLSLNK